MSYIEISYIINQLLNFKIEENEDENEKKEQLFNNLYETLKIINEISNCPELKLKVLNTLKEIFTNYEIHQNKLGKIFNNYIIGINPGNPGKSNLKNPYDFLRFNCEDFEICKYEVHQNGVITEIKMLRNNFFPIRYIQYDIDNIPQIQERIEEIRVTKKNLYTIDIEFIKTTKTYINSVLDNIVKKEYKLNNFNLQNFNDIGFNQILDIIYYEIEQKHLDETYFSSIKRCPHYPEYVEVIQGKPGKRIKFLAKIDLSQGFNNIENFQEPTENTICREDANIYTTYMLSGNKINSNLNNFLENIEDEYQKEQFKKYYKKINFLR